ncbi:hypothetical protein D9M71_525500 [compost metagenome]
MGEARCRGVDDQQRNAFVPCLGRVGTGRQPDEVGRFGTRGPQFVAIDHEAFVVLAGAGFQHRQVTAGFRFRVADGEHDLACGNAGQETFFLQLATVSHQGRTHGTDGHERQRRAGDVGFFEEDQLFGGGVTLAAMGLRPADRKPAVATHLADGLAKQLAAFLAAQLLAHVRSHQGLEIVPHLVAQGMLFGSEVDEHLLLLRLRRESGRWWVRRCRR